MKPSSSLTVEAPVDEKGGKCYYCIASDTHAPHLHNIRLCTCAFRSAKGVGPGSKESATALNTTSSAPRFAPVKLLTQSTVAPAPLVPVNGPDDSLAGGGASQARHNGMDLSPLSRFSMAGTGAATYRSRSIPSPYASGVPRETGSSIRPMARRDDPKGKRPLAASANGERSLVTTRSDQTFTSRSRGNVSVPPSPSDRGTADSTDEVTVAGDVDEGQPSNTTAPSASSGPLERSRKRRCRNSTVDDSRPRSATTRRVHHRRRQETSRHRAGSAPHALPQRACCAYIRTSSLSSMTGDYGLRAVPEPPLPHGNAIETLEQSHQRVRAYLASCFASNQRLRTELAEVREEKERLEERLTHAERDAFRYWERRVTG